MHSIKVLKSCLWMLLRVSCCFNTLTLGGAVDFDGAYLALIVKSLMPLCIYVLRGHLHVRRASRPQRVPTTL